MPQKPERSRFGLNLFAQFLLGPLVSSLGYWAPVPLRSLFFGIGGVISWSFSLGLLYGFFRLFNVRVQNLEWYYQNFPFGFHEHAAKTKEPEVELSPQGVTPPTDAPKTVRRAEPAPPMDWEKFFSVEYIRYAGLILIVSSIVALLFRIEWKLEYKIAASMLASACALAAAEYGYRRSLKIVCGSCFLIAVALFQFSLTLLFKYFVTNGEPGLLSDPRMWMAIKTAVSLVAVTGLLRYRIGFAPVLFFLIAYLTPLTLSWVAADIPVHWTLGFVMVMTAATLGFGVFKNHFEVAPLNILAASTYILSFYPFEKDLAVFAAMAAVYLLHLAAGTINIWRKQTADIGMNELMLPNSELILVQLISATGLCALQTNTPVISGYCGLTLLGMSIASLSAFLVLRAKEVNNPYTEMLLNSGLIISAIGMFIQTEGAWTAIVFLLFSCGAIYVSFIVGTLRTRIYAFLALTLSMAKLYFECAELFDSISGTTIILGIGVLLLVLSYKLENVKAIFNKKSTA